MRILLALTLSLFVTGAWATTLEALFEDNFFRIHVPGHCGQNILNFVKLAQKENIDLTDAVIINVDSGWVEPQFVRNGGFSPKVPGPEGLIYPPTKRYYYFHVFMIHEGKVYDFDYGNTPTVPALPEYFKKMWITGKNADNFLGLKVYKVADYLRGSKKPDVPTVKLLDFVHGQGR